MDQGQRLGAIPATSLFVRGHDVERELERRGPVARLDRQDAVALDVTSDQVLVQRDRQRGGLVDVLPLDLWRRGADLEVDQAGGGGQGAGGVLAVVELETGQAHPEDR